jgi:hypothetical protein
MWTPELEELGSITENVNFSHEITYFYGEGELGTLADVVITTNDNNSTVFVGGNSISGKYTDTFSSGITYKAKDKSFVTVDRFSNIPISNLEEVISFKASTEEYKVYNYTATAIVDNVVVATKTYTKTVVNDWTSGRDSLVQFVGYTL